MAERALHLEGRGSEPSLLLRCCAGTGRAVLYVHGATFPSALSVGYRFGGRSWLDDLAGHGFDAWAFDFAGFGGSDRYSAMGGGREGIPVGRANEAARQIARVVDYIGEATGCGRVSLIAHSWGSIPAALYTSKHPERVEALCLFGPIAQRNVAGLPAPESVGAWRQVTIAEQLARFVEDVPPGHPPVLIDEELRYWGPTYLATDPASLSREPAAVRIPSGPQADIFAAWSGALPYDPQDVIAPTLIVRGEWDSVSNDRDADWLLSRSAAPVRKDVKIAKGTHLMHLEHGRDALFAVVREFLSDVVPAQRGRPMEKMT
jgi:pimeloyl-ACP methyl ester carboxylesterase